MKEWIKPLEKMGACEEAIKWCGDYDTLGEAWLKCKRGDWMLWLLGRLSDEPESDSRKKLVLTACRCARLALPHVKVGELRPLKAIETTERWAMGEDGITLDDVRTAASAAYAAYAATSAASAAYAAYAATSAASAARKIILKKCAGIVREYYEAPELTCERK